MHNGCKFYTLLFPHRFFLFFAHTKVRKKFIFSSVMVYVSGNFILFPFRLEPWSNGQHWRDARNRCGQSYECPKNLPWRTYIHEVVVHVVQHGIYSLHTRHSYWSGRQSNVSISVVGTFYVKKSMANAAKCKVMPRKFYCRIGLQGHSCL